MVEENSKPVPLDDKTPVPFGATLKTLDLILKGMYIIKADRNFVTKETIKKNTGLYRHVNRNLPFLIYLNAVEKSKQSGLYKLTDLGARYAKAAKADNRVEMAKEMKNLLDVSFIELVNFATLRKSGGNLNFDTIFNHIKTEAKLKEDTKNPRDVNPAYAVGIHALIDMLILAGYVDESVKPFEPTQQNRKKANLRPKTSKTAPLKKARITVPTSQPTEQMYPITFGDNIIIYLKKGNKTEREKTAKLAKQFIDIYVEEG